VTEIVEYQPAVYQPPRTLPQSRTWLDLQNPALELANAIASTDFVPDSLRGNPAAITAAILYGDEVGLGPMQSLAKIAVINGRPTLAAEAQRALILAAGHDLWIEETSVTRCTIAGRRKGSEQSSRITWTADDAKRAGLAGKPPWRMYPRQMLLARASAELARAVFPDAIGGLSASEELEEYEQAAPASGGELAERTPIKTQTRRRQRASVSAGAPAPATPASEPASEPIPVPGDEGASGAPAALPAKEQAIVDELESELGATEVPVPGDEPAEPPKRLRAVEPPAPAPNELGPPVPGDDEDEARRRAAYPELEQPELGDELEPEPPAPITRRQRDKMMALFREKGFDDRESRLAFMRAITRRSDLTTGNDLTYDQASLLITMLEQQADAPPET
jgi:hypothetical protein